MNRYTLLTPRFQAFVVDVIPLPLDHAAYHGVLLDGGDDDDLEEAFCTFLLETAPGARRSEPVRAPSASGEARIAAVVRAIGEAINQASASFTLRLRMDDLVIDELLACIVTATPAFER